MFYERFIELCEKNGVAPSVVAKEIGLSNSATTYWKRGAMPKAETLQRIADYFGVSIAWMLGHDEPTETEVRQSMKLDDYVKALGFEFHDSYPDAGSDTWLCVDNNEKKLYLLSQDDIAECEHSIQGYAKFQIADLLKKGKEIPDTGGWFKK